MQMLLQVVMITSRTLHGLREGMRHPLLGRVEFQPQERRLEDYATEPRVAHPLKNVPSVPCFNRYMVVFTRMIGRKNEKS
jgi:hypothetical protein